MLRKEKLPPFTSPEALCSYYSGIRHHNNYQKWRNQAELEQAIRYFRIRHSKMTNFGFGLFLYGVALTENRDEQNAIKIFKKVLELAKKEQPYYQLLKFQTELWLATERRPRNVTSDQQWYGKCQKCLEVEAGTR